MTTMEIGVYIVSVNMDPTNTSIDLMVRGTTEASRFPLSRFMQAIDQQDQHEIRLVFTEKEK